MTKTCFRIHLRTGQRNWAAALGSDAIGLPLPLHVKAVL